jgi:outer membrane lipoprotein carrier protein
MKTLLTPFTAFTPFNLFTRAASAACLVAALSAAYAQSSPSTTTSATPPQTATTGAGLQAMRSFVAQQKSISGEFVQTVQGKNIRQVGRFAMSKPAQFRWEIQKPFEQLLVSDGKTLTQWDVDLNQATQRNAEGLLNNTPAALLLGGAAVEKQFGLADAGSAEGLDWVQAVPKNTEGQFKSIKLGFKKGVPVVLLAQDAFGGNSRIELKNVSTRAIDAGQFRFTPPAGADIVKM